MYLEKFKKFNQKFAIISDGLMSFDLITVLKKIPNGTKSKAGHNIIKMKVENTFFFVKYRKYVSVIGVGVSD